MTVDEIYCRETIETKAKSLLEIAEKSVVSADGFEREHSRYSHEKTETRLHKSRLHLLCVCLPTVNLVEVWTWIKMSYSRQSPNRPFEGFYLRVKPKAKACLMCVFPLLWNNHHGSLITPLHAISGTTLPGHWLMHKSQITSCFLLSPPFFLFPKMVAWFTDPIWLPSGQPKCVFTWACKCVRRNISLSMLGKKMIQTSVLTTSLRTSSG